MGTKCTNAAGCSGATYFWDSAGERYTGHGKNRGCNLWCLWPHWKDCRSGQRKICWCSHRISALGYNYIRLEPVGLDFDCSPSRYGKNVLCNEYCNACCPTQWPGSGGFFLGNVQRTNCNPTALHGSTGRFQQTAERISDQWRLGAVGNQCWGFEWVTDVYWWYRRYYCPAD